MFSSDSVYKEDKLKRITVVLLLCIGTIGSVTASAQAASAPTPIVRAHVAATRQAVESKANSVDFYLCTHTRGWHCANWLLPRTYAAWYPGPRRWTTLGGYLMYRAGAWNWFKGVFGFHVPHLHCTFEAQWQNYPLVMVWHWERCSAA